MLVYSGVIHPGVAQLVARLTGGQEAAGSSPVTRTSRSVLVGFKSYEDILLYATFFLGQYTTSTPCLVCMVVATTGISAASGISISPTQ